MRNKTLSTQRRAINLNSYSSQELIRIKVEIEAVLLQRHGSRGIKEAPMFTGEDMERAMDAAKNETQRLLADHFGDFIYPLIESEKRMNVIFARIEGAAMNKNSQQGREDLAEMSLGAELSKEFIRNIECARAAGLSDDDSEQAKMVKDYVTGVTNFINGRKGSSDPEGDDGEYLREVIKQYPTHSSRIMLAIRDRTKIVNSGPTHREPYRDLLEDMWRAVKAQHADYQAKDTRAEIIRQLEGKQPRSTDEQQALDELQKTKIKNLSSYSRNLLEYVR